MVDENLCRREKRVVGVLVTMVGAGLILDRGALVAGVACLLAGGLTFAWGLMPSARRLLRTDRRAPAPLETPP